ncbi:hypothetical protein WJX81_001362 [Elliptochloris bilobata]|uniref:DET1- and DDB1-associated protein 1 domain-containing protein n=1 Tax=Elliptochloris bilobata TaxID=381761 RepID=A0AAW1SL70_9CHLO
MEDLLNLPCHCPLNFSETVRNRSLAPRHKKDLRPRLYIATHDRTEAPADQVIATEKQSILLREFYRIGLNRGGDNVAAPSKRAASPADSPRHAKMLRQDFAVQ